MRFLCLHGKGTSAKIFETQSAAFRYKLNITPPPTFDFIDGPFSSDAAAGIELFYPGPYYSFTATMSATSYRAAHQWLLDLLERKGPYDGVMTFSQGGSLASSLLLYHAMVTPHLPPPFKVAVFICSGIPLVALEDLGIPVPQKARDLDESSRQALFAQADTEAILARGADRWIGLEAPGYDATAPVKETDVSGLDFTKFSNEFRIKIPTVHIYGARDPRRPASLQLAQFCIKENRRVFDHGDGHEIPRRRDVSAKIAELIEWTVVKIKQ